MGWLVSCQCHKNNTAPLGNTLYSHIQITWGLDAMGASTWTSLPQALSLALSSQTNALIVLAGQFATANPSRTFHKPHNWDSPKKTGHWLDDEQGTMSGPTWYCLLGQAPLYRRASVHCAGMTPALPRNWAWIDIDSAVWPHLA